MAMLAFIAIGIAVVFIYIAITYGLIPGLEVTKPEWLQNILSAGG